MKSFPRLAFTQMVYLLGVILFGAYVRASGSGAGCGSHWPLCNGDVIPLAPSLKTIIEYTHRLTSGLSLPMAITLFFLARRQSKLGAPQQKAASRFAGFTLIFLITEALIGAGLVLLQHVADNTSYYRALSMSLHLINTFFLMACATLTWVNARFPKQVIQGFSPSFYLGASLLLLTGLTGAITALGDTVFPMGSTGDAWRQSLEAGEHLFVKLRIYHPLIAMGSAAILLVLVRRMGRSHPLVFRMALLFSGLLITQLLMGYLNVFLLAPIWLQILHLLCAQCLWISFVILGALSPSKSSDGVMGSP